MKKILFVLFLTVFITLHTHAKQAHLGGEVKISLQDSTIQGGSYVGALGFFGLFGG